MSIVEFCPNKKPKSMYSLFQILFLIFSEMFTPNGELCDKLTSGMDGRDWHWLSPEPSSIASVSAALSSAVMLSVGVSIG